MLAGEAFSYGVARLGKNIMMSVWIGLASIVLIGYPSSIIREYNKISPNSFFDSPPSDWVEVMKYVQRMPDKKPIFSMMQAGFYIPTYSAHKVYVGHVIATPHYAQRLGEAYTFFKGTNICEAYTLLKDNNIGTVFYGFDEQGVGSAVDAYPFLKKQHSIGSTTIFTVMDQTPTICL
jgi:hypothetical protein